MGLLARWKNIFKAKANQATEAVESQNLCAILEASLEDEKKNLREAEVALNEVGGQEKSLADDVNALYQSVKDWAHNAETALAVKNEDLARKALERQTHVEAELASKRTALASVHAAHEKLTKDILARKQKVDEVSERLKSLKAEEKAADVTLRARQSIGAGAGDGSALDQIKVFEQRVRDKVNTAESASEFDAKASGADVTAEFAKLEQNAATDAKMAALKAKMAGSDRSTL